MMRSPVSAYCFFPVYSLSLSSSSWTVPSSASRAAWPAPIQPGVDATPVRKFMADRGKPSADSLYAGSKRSASWAALATNALSPDMS